MQEIRCGHCRRKLAEARFERLKIKCPRCGTMNDVRAIEPPTRAPGASNTPRGNDAQKRSSDP
ncbi:MAG: Com family DNA-binding transcriptional regulator [Pseudomonadota bacterium]